MTTDEMTRRDLVRLLVAAGWNSIRNDGNHEVYGCPCGRHIAPVPRHRVISAGVVRKVRRVMRECEAGQ